MALALARRGRAASVVGIDFSGEMLRLGREKVKRAAAASGRAPIGLTRGDAMRLPLPSSCVDTVTVAFGIRNVQEPAVACREMARVLTTGGRLAILEFSMPQMPVVSQSIAGISATSSRASDGWSPSRGGLYLPPRIGRRVGHARDVRERAP